MREDLKETLEKHYPGGFYLYGVLQNKTIDVMIHNPKEVEGIEATACLVNILQKFNPDIDKWVSNDKQSPQQ